MPSPYQRQLFSGLAAADDIDLAVRYYTVGAHDREWQAPDFEPFEAALPGHVVSALGPSAHWNRSVISDIKKVDADLVVVSDYSALTAQAAMRWLSMNKRPFMFWGEVPGFAQRGPIGTFVRGRLQAPLRKAKGIAAIGSRAEAAYRELFPAIPTYNIPYFCDLSPYQKARCSRKTKTGDTIDLLYSGQLIERKGVDTLIQAFVTVAHDVPNLRLQILGNGPDKGKLKDLIPSDLKERVIFFGHKEPAELPALFANADLFCLPSRHDGWGVVVNEAIGAGLPVISTDAVGAALDMVKDGENGLMTPAGDADALAAALRKISEDGARREMTKAAMIAARSWGIDEGVSRWRAAAREVLER
jgi:glycosyltransferase involved in cell wall biosynthesis